MIAILSRNILPLLFLFIMPVQCATGNKNNTNWKQDLEGYLFLDIRLFGEADENGFARQDKPVSDKAFLPVSRKMYIYQHYLIDIIKNVQVTNGQYTKTDTIGYELYDLMNQKFARFTEFSPGAALNIKGDMAGAGGSFSNMPGFDPMNGIPDSIWHITDAVMNKDTLGIITFNAPEGSAPEDTALFKRTKFWVNYKQKNFPLQLSYLLSKKLNNALVFKMQQTSPDGVSLMVTTLKYQQADLPENILLIFKRWSEMMNGG